MNQRSRCIRLVALALACLAAAGCVRPDDSAAIQNHHDHTIELWSVFEDDSLPNHQVGLIGAGDVGPLPLRDCLAPPERIEIRHPDGTVLEAREDLCRGEHWDIGAQ